VNLEKVEKDGVQVNRLIPGESYTIPIKIKNISITNNYNVKNGKCIIVLTSLNGQEIYRKEITDISVSSGEEKELFETFVFNPIDIGSYILKYAYTDETLGENLYFREVQSFRYGTSIGIVPDKTDYNYLDTANMGVKIIGVGTYQLFFTCQEAGIDELRDVHIPEESFEVTEI
jgi:hypothetical protein